jgi:NAD(P)-dependent dehydrogenase (short-subunit alcohol dehydrogenase family)
MSTATAASREPELLGQTVVVIGGSAGIGLETARRARAEGAKLILTSRNPERLEHAARELGALSSAAFDATDFERLERFFDELPTPIDHLMVTAGGPYYARLADIDFAQARHNVDAVFWLPLHIARRAVGKVRPQAGRSSSSAEQAVAGRPRAHSSRRSPPRYQRSPRRSRSSSHPSASTSSPPASSTHRCRHRSSAMNSKTAAISFAPCFPSGASSYRPTLPRSPYTS